MVDYCINIKSPGVDVKEQPHSEIYPELNYMQITPKVWVTSNYTVLILTNVL